MRPAPTRRELLVAGAGVGAAALGGSGIASAASSTPKESEATRVYRLLRRFENVDQALVRADFERFSRLLVHVRRAQNAVLVLHCRQRNRPRYLRTRPLRRIDDLGCRLIEHTVVVSFESDSDFVVQDIYRFLAPFTRLERASMMTCLRANP